MKQKGISLIVLIVTIIVIIILAAAVILTLNRNNPVDSAKEATFKQDVRTFQDELAMYIAKDYTAKAGARDDKINAMTYDKIKDYIPSFSKKYDGKFVIKNDELVYKEDNLTEDEKVWVSSMDVKGIENTVPQEWQTYIAAVTKDGVPIPKGFTYLTGTKATGVVIEDENHNEFVWVPSTIGEYEKDKTILSNGSVTGEDTILSELDETLDVIKYGGFYIGRYEATIPEGASSPINTVGEPTCQKRKNVWTYINYANSKASAESMYTGDDSSVLSGLLTGKSWDRTCHWIEDYITTINQDSKLRDSRYYGNYINSESPADNGSGTIEVAGFNENWKTKNIYDLAGNIWEWTYEANSSDRFGRGGCFDNDGKNYPILWRNSLGRSAANSYIGFRIRLYIKTT